MVNQIPIGSIFYLTQDSSPAEYLAHSMALLKTVSASRIYIFLGMSLSFSFFSIGHSSSVFATQTNLFKERKEKVLELSKKTMHVSLVLFLAFSSLYGVSYLSKLSLERRIDYLQASVNS